MVHAVHRKVHQNGEGVVRQQVIDVEEEAVERVLEDRPDDVAGEEAREDLRSEKIFQYDEWMQRKKRRVPWRDFAR
jgi:hypothetical protein